MHQFCITDLPEDAKVFNLDRMINLDTAQLQTKTTGAKIIQKLQEYLLSHVTMSENCRSSRGQNTTSFSGGTDLFLHAHLSHIDFSQQ